MQQHEHNIVTKKNEVYNQTECKMLVKKKTNQREIVNLESEKEKQLHCKCFYLILECLVVVFCRHVHRVMCSIRCSRGKWCALSRSVRVTWPRKISRNSPSTHHVEQVSEIRFSISCSDLHANSTRFCCINGNVLIDAIATSSFRSKSSSLLHSLIPIPMIAFFYIILDYF